MKRSIYLFILVSITISVTLTACKKDEGSPSAFNLFTVDDDMAFGEEFSKQIEANPTEYPTLSEVEYQQAYQHIYRIRDSVLNTGLVNFDDKFIWQVKIIDNDSTLNAFAVPGGYLYFYTGLIKYLENEAEFAGVMAHEMAHVSLRHSTNQLTKNYGISILLSIILGNDPHMLAQIAADLAAGLSSLAFSRNHEYQADEWAVKYTYETSYDARGIGAFFEKMEGAPHPPTFMSTHPSPDDRLEKINEHWQNLGGKVGNTYEALYNDFKNSLP
jgi:predicted Zn-dependent protease